MNLKKEITLFFVFFFAISVFAQTKEKDITISFTDIPLSQAIKRVENVSVYTFFYDAAKIDLKQNVSLSAKNTPVQKAIESLLQGTNIQFEITNTQIALYLKESKPLSKQSNKKITGTVVDAKGDPIIGASIMIKGTKTGTITNLDGKFSIDATEQSILSISYVGFTSLDVKVGSQPNLKIKLEEDTQLLDEVVVVGYGTQKKVNLTGAVQQITAKQLDNRSVLNIGQALQGSIPNLNVTITSGRATAKPTLNIRGTGSLSGSQPLIVIDGVAASQDEMIALNVNDIASISTLMDAASCAIYGARASFGVILITTKDAGKDAIQVTVNSNLSFRKPTVVPEFILDQNTAMRARLAATGGWYTLHDIYGVNDWDYLDKVTNGEAPQTILNPEDPTKWMTAGRTNWYKEAMRDNGIAQNHNISVSGRTQKMKYYFSGAYSRQDGVFKYGNDIFDKYNFRGKVDFDITSWLTLSNNSSYYYDTYDEPSQGFSFSGLMNTSTLDVIKNLDGSWTSSGASIFGSTMEGGRKFTKTSKYATSFTANARFFNKMLSITAKSSFLRSNQGVQAHYLPVAYNVGPNKTQFQHPVLDAQRDAYGDSQNVFDLYADFDKTYRKHHVHALLGYNQEYRYNDWFKAYRKDLISSNVPSIQLATGDKEVGESITDWSTRSGFFRFNYDYDGKYLFEVNGRKDGTSRFPVDDRFCFFPSISLGWNIAKENFFAPLNRIVTTLKPRYSNGILGNQNVGAYDYLPIMSSGKTSSILSGNKLEQQITIYSPGIVASSLTWEKIKTTNYGIDFGFLNNRLTGSFDYYHRAVSDMLTKSKKLPSVLGTSEPMTNAANMVTKGFELVLSWKDGFKLLGDMFNYSVGGTLADSRAWITKFDNPEGRLNDYYTGYEIGTIWGYQVNGLFQSAAEVKNHANQSSFWTYPGKVTPGPGDIKFEDLNGDGQIKGANTINDLQDQKIIGNSRSRYNVGFTGSFDWKGFDFNMFVQGVLKKDWYPSGYNFWGLNAGPWTNLQKYQYENSWTPENPGAYMPRLKGYAATTWSGAEMIQTNTRYLQNAAYLRLKSVTIGYSLPMSVIKKAKMSQVRVFATGENLLTWTGIKNPNLDPETLGEDYPMQKVISVGLNVKF